MDTIQELAGAVKEWETRPVRFRCGTLYRKPPGAVAKAVPCIVSPGAGRRGTLAVRSMLMEPMVTIIMKFLLREECYLSGQPI